jgi:lysophospholipase L1-like esterase
VRVSFLGDSLTEGRPGESFLRRLERLLPDDELLDLGRAGDTVPSLLARLRAGGVPAADAAVLWIGTNDAFLGDWYLPPLVDAAEPWTTGAPPDDEAAGAPPLDAGDPDAVDAGGGAGAYDARRLRPAYDALLDLALDASPLVVCVPPLLPDPFEGAVAQRVAAIAATVATAAAARAPQALVCDLAPAFAAAGGGSAGGAFTIDGVHLSARGADVVAAAFRALIDRLRARSAGA